MLVVFLPYESFQYSINFINIKGDRWFRILRIECTIGVNVAIALHALFSCQRGCSIRILLILTSTCSFDQLSMLNDLTLDIWVPSFRWREAHRMHKNIPSYSGSIMRSISHHSLHHFTYTPTGPSCKSICQLAQFGLSPERIYLDSLPHNPRTGHCPGPI